MLPVPAGLDSLKAAAGLGAAADQLPDAAARVP